MVTDAVIVVFPKCVAKCKFLTGCDHCHIKFKFDRSICKISLVGALMMHINIVIMQESSLHVYRHWVYTTYTPYAYKILTTLHIHVNSDIAKVTADGMLYHAWLCVMPCKEGCCSVAWNCDLNDVAVWSSTRAQDHPDQHWITNYTNMCIVRRQLHKMDYHMYTYI